MFLLLPEQLLLVLMLIKYLHKNACKNIKISTFSSVLLPWICSGQESIFSARNAWQLAAMSAQTQCEKLLDCSAPVLTWCSEPLAGRFFFFSGFVSKSQNVPFLWLRWSIAEKSHRLQENYCTVHSHWMNLLHLDHVRHGILLMIFIVIEKSWEIG